MDIYSTKLKLASVLVGILIAVLASLIAVGVMRYFFGVTGVLNIVTVMMIFILFLDIIQWLFGPYLIGATFRLHKIERNDVNYSWLIDSVDRVASMNNVKSPEVFISEINIPNAFAYGSPIAGKRLAVTRGLVNILSRDELEAVVGHEIGHLKHRDVELIMAIGLIPSIIFYLGYSLLFAGAFGGNNRNGGGAMLLIAAALMFVSFIFNLMILGVNRMRESYADINSAQTVQNGAENLQIALAKIVAYTTPMMSRKLQGSSSFTRMLFFSSADSKNGANYQALLDHWKTQKVSRFLGIFSDHPHPAKRIQMLERYKNQF